ncbi:MAG: hypothetical protein AV945_gp10 [Phormidium phage MIS-PhV1B]|jgi:hypothetical protein|uniref:hypothetical protein n=1 Tax=Phormidium phage MIS-PhV1B TaxID=1391456 RepID=UPI0003C9E619|nr:MAG: hypothetical protein AV945_gp10 [Phormidium phage MIS-PhV1B]AGZ61817.1 MAG: hypothetical protein [Phormidium phage MIS-PhV1B]
MQHFAQRMQCKITLGRLIKSARKDQKISQQELRQLIIKKYSINIDHFLISNIESCRVDVRDREYDWLLPVLAEIFDCDIEWLEQIRSQTEPEPLDLSKAMFPVYFKP